MTFVTALCDRLKSQNSFGADAPCENAGEGGRETETGRERQRETERDRDRERQTDRQEDRENKARDNEESWRHTQK